MAHKSAALKMAESAAKESERKLSAAGGMAAMKADMAHQCRRRNAMASNGGSWRPLHIVKW
jgi:hypothetical protein